MANIIGIIGGSGFYSLLDSPESVSIETKYGNPSDKISLGKISGVDVAFLPRHGTKHNIPPHKVPYRANILAFEELGVNRIIATNAVGSLKSNYIPGDFVLFDQFVNMTNGRHDTFFDEDKVAHVSMAEPYCSDLRTIAAVELSKMNIRYHENGSVIVINGPRFSSKAESRFFSSQGFDVINMTQYPEAALAREKGMCYLGIGIVTDYDAGLEGNPQIKAVTAEEVNRVFGKSIAEAKSLINNIVPTSSKAVNCNCKNSLIGAVVTK